MDAIEKVVQEVAKQYDGELESYPSWEVEEILAERLNVNINSRVVYTAYKRLQTVYFEEM